jgi:glycosyltransferase involved in cell wall biosynthesis
VRLLAVCDGPPTLDPRFGDGATLISAQLLRRLPSDIEIDLVYFADRPAGPPHALVERCANVTSLPLASTLAGIATTLPVATRLRFTREARRVVASSARRADVTYLHGLGTFPFARVVPGPVVVHEVDPWSLYWRERAQRARLHRRLYGPRLYDLWRASRALALERSTAERASSYLVVSDPDASALRELVGHEIRALPNGVEPGPLAPQPEDARPASRDGERGLIGSVGTLDYAPNVDAVVTLARDVLPRVRRQVPEARLLLAGRRPTQVVKSLAGPGVEIAADVRNIAVAYQRPSVLAYPGTYGRGMKNTVMEALAYGRPVVASPSAARGIAAGPHISIVRDVASMSGEIARLLEDTEARRAMREAAVAYAASLPTWDDVSARFAQILHDAT